MKVTKIIPQGFCYGVAYAYNETKKIIQNNPNKKIYMLGWLVHNQHIVNELSSLGLIILDDKQTSRKQLVANINEPNSILILSAHGTPNDVVELAKTKGLDIYDLTCRYVYKTHTLIKDWLQTEADIIFIGKYNHPETKAILKLSDKIQLVEKIEDIDKLVQTHQKVYCTNQTTLGTISLQKIIEKLYTKFPELNYVNDICDATRLRQEAVLKMDKDIDICLIVGDVRSNNCDELYQLAKSITTSYKVGSLDDVDTQILQGKKHCGITAGASTPSYLVEQIIEFIKQYND